MAETPAIEMKAVTKRFGPTVALDEVSLTIGVGESRGLIGRNGAGKSTLISILTGMSQADSGRVEIMAQGKQSGRSIACVYQHSTLIPAATAAENIALGQYPRDRLGLVDWNQIDTDARRLLDEWDLATIAKIPVTELEPLEKKVVEICRVLSSGPRVLILDEPTAGLDRDQTVRLFRYIQRARSWGVTVMYVSHHLQELYEVCDSVSILRDGRLIGTKDVATVAVDDLVRDMVGPESPNSERRSRVEHTYITQPGYVELRGISKPPLVNDVSLSVGRGECFGITGLDGAGHFELANILSGRLQPSAGTMRVDGALRNFAGERDAINAGINFAPADRRAAGFVPGMSVAENATMPILNHFRTRYGALSYPKMQRHYRRLSDEWEIVSSGPEQPTEELSGGNQQKVVLARALSSEPQVLVLMNPTAGVDVKAKSSIYASVERLTRQGHAIVIVSSDDSEFNICNRVAVMYKGTIAQELVRPFSESDIASASQGPGSRNGSHFARTDEV